MFFLWQNYDIMIVSEIYQDTLDFIAKGPNSEQIVHYKPSEKIQERARFLIQKEKEGKISLDEKQELEQILFFDHIMRLIKARAKQYIS
jgi:hypothetical protein